MSAASMPVMAVHQTDFGAGDNVIPLRAALTPYHAPGGGEAAGTRWYMLAVTNGQVRPATRVLLAGQPPRLALSFLPRATRPAIVAVASTDAGVIVEPAPGYGHRAWRVIVPPVTQVGLAIQVSNAQTPPALYAWTEPALAAHNRSLAIFITAVAALIAAAALITGGLAVLIGHAAPRWVALTLGLLLLSWLAGTGMFDASLATHIGGPYGLSAFLTALTLAAGARLADAIIPLRDIWPRHAALFHRALYGLCALGALAWLGLPGATLLTDMIAVAGSTAIAAYLFLCGRRGIRAAQVVAPSAAAFALVALASAVTAAGGMGESLTGPATTGGFAAAGAILLALAVIASEEIAVLPFLHGSHAARILEAQARAVENNEGGMDASLPLADLALAAVGAAREGVFALDPRAQLVTLSPQAAEMLGLCEHDTTLPLADWLARLHPDDRDAFRRLPEAWRGKSFAVEFRARLGTEQEARYGWFELRASVSQDNADCLGLITDIAARKASGGNAAQDALTGLGNRVALMAALDGLAAPDTLLAVADLDRFKAVHASLGDAGGDAVLAATAGRLKARFGKDAQVFRTGGDGFALLFARPPEKPEVLGAALAALCRPPHLWQGREVFAPVSVGLAQGGGDPLALIKNAEVALSAAKRAGGDRAQLYHAGLEAEAPPDAVAMEADLRRALARDEIAVHYQPIMRLETGTVAGFEALLRWQHPERGPVAPADFIGHSEETGLIVALGRLALERAAGELAHWQHYFPVQPPLFVSVNLSRRQLQDGGFERLFQRVLKESGVAPGTLRLEVTESAVGEGTDMTETLARLRAAGAGLSIDDFGTGASTLSRLAALPFDTLKIDRSFLTGRDESGQVVLGSVIAMARELGRTVVAEGVENAAEAAWLRALGCEYGQGYHFSAPLAPSETLAFIARHYDVTAVTPS